MIIQVKVKPGSRNNKIQKDAEGNWILQIKAQPVDGKANEELIRFLSHRLSIAKSRVQIISGHSARIKRINIEDLDLVQVKQKLLSK